MRIRNILLLFIGSVIITIGACNKDNDQDTEYPVIDMSGPDAYPKNCDSINKGEAFTVKALFTDNVELGAYTIDIHENFDHHSHSADIGDCNLDQIKDPDSPFSYIQSFDIPDGLQSYSVNEDIYIPQDVDSGDYHFMIRLTDKAGWQSIYALSIKIL